MIIKENVFLLGITAEYAKFIVHFLAPAEIKLVDTDRNLRNDFNELMYQAIDLEAL